MAPVRTYAPAPLPACHARACAQICSLTCAHAGVGGVLYGALSTSHQTADTACRLLRQKDSLTAGDRNREFRECSGSNQNGCSHKDCAHTPRDKERYAVKVAVRGGCAPAGEQPKPGLPQTLVGRSQRGRPRLEHRICRSGEGLSILSHVVCRQQQTCAAARHA